MAKGKAHLLTKPLVGPEDAGTYRCELGTVSSGPATIMRFQVTVLPPKVMEEEPSSNVITNTDGRPGQATPAGSAPSSTLHAPQPENMLRSRLVGLLICCVAVLIAGIATAMLCRGKAMSKTKSSQLDVGSDDEDEETSKNPKKAESTTQ